MQSHSQTTWVFNHHIFVVRRDRLCIECSRLDRPEGKPKRLRRQDKLLQVIPLGSELIDCVYDLKYKLCFIICRDGGVHTYLYSINDLQWKLVDTLSIAVHSQRLVESSCCCVNGHIYWQSQPIAGASSQCTDIYSVQYHVAQGCEAGHVISITFDTPKQVVGGCLPCDLMAYGSNLVLALPRHEKMKGMVMYISAVKFVVTHILQGVIACHDHLLTPVQFSSVTLPIMAALQSPQGRNMNVKVVLTDRHRLIMVCSDGAVWMWELSDAVGGTGTVGFHKLDTHVDTALLSASSSLLYRDRLVFIDSDLAVIKYVKLNSGTVHSASTQCNLALYGWCYCYTPAASTPAASTPAAPADVLLLSEDETVTSLSQVLADSSSPDQMLQRSAVVGLDGEDIYQPPTSMSALTTKFQSLVEQAPRGSCVSQLVEVMEDRNEMTTPFSQQLAKTLHESEESLMQSNKQNISSMVITSGCVHQLLGSTTQDNLASRVATLTHYIDVAPKTCLSAFTGYLQSDSDTVLEHWRSLFRLNYHQKSHSPPLIMLYLYLVWVLHPADIVNKVLLVGSRYKECMSATTAPSSLVDSLIDMIELSYAEDIKTKRSSLLSYSRLCMLSSCEYKVLQALKLMKDSDIEEQMMKRLIEEYCKTSTLRHSLVSQFIGST